MMTEQMLPQELIRKKRDGGALSPDEIAFFVRGLADGSISSEQVSAMAMAIYFNTMTFAEIGELTRAMVASGHTIDWSHQGLDGVVIDKHSTGGVGDKVSLMLAPLVAACGAYVPMISGPALGHTGGTLDKLDSVTNYKTSLDLESFREVVKSVGCAIIGQTEELAPADKRFYAIRDVTATVESIPLITASILSKKIAAGLDALVMDVKIGNGAFMQTLADAEQLADSIINTAAEAGLPVRATITDMSAVLGRNAGNAVEIMETIDYLTGTYRDERLQDVVTALAIDMLCMIGLADEPESAERQINAALDGGKAAEIFAKMVSAQGGPHDFIESAAQHLPQAAVKKPAYAKDAGFVTHINVREVGNIIVALGGGRKRVEDKIDYSVGLTDVAGIGVRVDADKPIAYVHARDEDSAEQAIEGLRHAFSVSEEKLHQLPASVICERLA